MKPDPVRSRILELIANRHPSTDLKKASLACGKNHAYLHQFIHRGTPRKLPEDIRHALAAHLGVDESVLRSDGPVPSYVVPHPALDPEKLKQGVGFDPAVSARYRQIVPVPEVRVSASAGGGAVNDVEPRGDNWYFPAEWLRHELRARSNDLRIITIDGDSMEPVLESGDRVLVDISRRAPSPPGVFILFDGIGLVAKQLEFVPNSEPPRVIIRSANADYRDYERTIDEVNIVGRVVWFARRL
jgi:phage repressor protein C with HTH and peptisase S24 domain